MNARLAVRVQPGARREGLLGRSADGVWRRVGGGAGTTEVT